MAGIVVGVDSSEESARALEWAVAEAERWQKPLTVVNAYYVQYSADVVGPQAAQSMSAPMHEHAERVVQQRVAALGRQPDIEMKTAAIEGAPGRVLVEMSADADLVVVGSRGHGGFLAVRLGSVSNQVAHHAVCPVVVVPGPERHLP